MFYMQRRVHYLLTKPSMCQLSWFDFRIYFLFVGDDLKLVCLHSMVGTRQILNSDSVCFFVILWQPKFLNHGHCKCSHDIFSE